MAFVLAADCYHVWFANAGDPLAPSKGRLSSVDEAQGQLMSNENSINVFDDIQSLCSDFRRQLKRGERKRIEDYLDGVGKSSTEMLFQNLLLIDIEFRRRRKENPSSDEYIARFPQFARLIRQSFFESTMMSQEMLEDTPDDDETLMVGMPAAGLLLAIGMPLA